MITQEFSFVSRSDPRSRITIITNDEKSIKVLFEAVMTLARSSEFDMLVDGVKVCKRKFGIDPAAALRRSAPIGSHY